MRFGSGAAAMIGLALMAGSAQADARHYDCTKPGNANKAACKTPVTAPAAPASAPAPPAATASKVERHYDCSKPGNAKKAACKTAAPAPAAAPASRAAPSAAAAPATPPQAAPGSPAPAALGSPAPAAGGSPRIVAYTQKNGKVVHYDCSKAGNFTKKACRP